MSIATVLYFLLAVTAGIAQQPNPIRQIDFKNFSYPFSPGWTLDGPSTGEWLDAPRETLLIRNGRYEIPSEEYFVVGDIYYGDLNGDSRDEAVIDVVYGAGGTANWHYLYVFTERDGRAELVACLESGSRAYGGIYDIVIQANQLILDFADGERRIGDCCSRGVIRVTYRLDGKSFVEAAARQRDSVRLEDFEPRSGVSLDKGAVASIRQDREVWIFDAVEERKVFTCPSRCRNPQFNPDGRSVFVVVDTGKDSGGVWKIDLATGTGLEFIRDSARFRVIQQGPYPGFIIADQRTLNESDGTPSPYPFYAFFIFRPSGSRIGRVGGEVDELDALVKEYSQ